MYTEGMHLSDYMAENQLSDEAVAVKIKRSRATVSRIRRRKVRPDWKTIKVLEKFSGGVITANDFLNVTPSENARASA
jgi:ribosome-binding protein aMBF1 (putative translation factor)